MRKKQRARTMTFLPRERVEQDDRESHRKESEDEVGGKSSTATPKRTRGAFFRRAQLLPDIFQF